MLEDNTPPRRGVFLYLVVFVLGIGAGLIFAHDPVAIVSPPEVDYTLLEDFLSQYDILALPGYTISYYTPAQGGDTTPFSTPLIADFICAVNPAEIPYGSTVLVNGMGYRAQDTGDFTLDGKIIGLCSATPKGMLFNQTLLVIVPKE